MDKKDTALLEHMGAVIKANRRLKKIDQEDFAFTLNLSRGSVSNIEKGRQAVSHVTLLKICSLLNLTPNDIYHSEIPTVVLVTAPKVERKIRQIKSLKLKLKKLESELGQNH